MNDSVVYMLVNYGGDTIEQALDRIYTLRRLGFRPFVMVYNKHLLPSRHPFKQIQRWINDIRTFMKVERFEDYVDKHTKPNTINSNTYIYGKEIQS